MSEAMTNRPQAEKGTSLWDDAWRRLKKNRLAIVGTALLVFVVLACAFGPMLMNLAHDGENIVEDTFPEFAAQNTDVQVCVDDPPPVTFTYTKTFSADDFPDCTESEVPNTATFTTTDTGAQAFDGWVLTVVRDCPTCNLTQGYWKTHNANFWGGAPEDPTWLTLLGDDPDNVPFFGNSFSWFDAMWTAPAGNAYWQLSRQWIAATLNVTAGSDGSSVAAELACGEALFNTYSPDDVAMWDNDSGGPLAGCPLTANPTRHDVIMWAAALDGFNNSNHCDDDGLYAADYDDGLPIQ